MLDYICQSLFEMASYWPTITTAACSSEDKKKLDCGETIVFKSPFGDQLMSKRFADSSSVVEMDLSNPIKVHCPIRILHGVKDDTVPYENSIEIMKLVTSEDVDLIFRKIGGHQLSEKGDLDLLSDTVDSTVKMLDL